MKSTRFRKKRHSCFAEEETVSDGEIEADILFIDQPLASLIMHKHKDYIILPYPSIGRKIIVTSFDVKPENKAIAETPSVRGKIILSGYTGWKDLPFRSILGQVNISECKKLNKEDVAYFNGLRTFERTTDKYQEGLYLCSINEVCKITPIKTGAKKIISSVKKINTKFGAIRKLQT